MNKNVEQIYTKLIMKYGYQGWWPVYSLRNTNNRDERGYMISSVPVGTGHDLSLRESSKYEIAIGAILTQNTAWTNVEKALLNLKKLNLIDPGKILYIDEKELAEIIRPSGYYNQKAKKIKLLTNFLIKGNYLTGENIPSRDSLLRLWGIGNETADSILLYGYNIPVFVVDTYTTRIFTRLGLLNEDRKYEDISIFFTDNLEKNYKIYQEYHSLIIKHAKEHCHKKPICEGCVLNNICLFPPVN